MATEIILHNASTSLATRDAELSAGVAEQVKNAKSEASRRAYEADWRTFEAWCSSMNAQALPPDDAMVAKFLRAQFDKGRKIKTLARYVSGVAYGFRARGFDWDIPKLIKEQMKGAKHMRAGKERLNKKAAITTDLLERVVGRASVRDRALLLLGWTGAFRRAELVALLVEDLQFGPEGISAYISKSKTDQEGKGDQVAIPYARNEALCAVRAVRAWLDLSKREAGYVFDISAQSVALVVKRAVAREGIPPEAFAGHSLRSGFATSAAQRRVPLQNIMNQTRHSDVRIVREYIRSANLFEDSGAKGLL